MKPTHFFGVLLAVSTLQAQTLNPTGTSGSSALPAPTPYAVVSQKANSVIWQRTTYDQAPDGSIVPQIHQYTELATGLNHLVNAQWVASKEEIDISPDSSSASATNGQHQVYFPGNIYNSAIKLVTPDGQILESDPIGLSYSDGSNSVLIATVTNATGAILPSGNQVIYTNAFAGLNADLLYTYTKAGFEQDIILREQAPDPVSLGLNSAETRLQVLTEFITAPQPTVTATTLSTAAGNLEDDTLGFGAMQMGHGKAFLIGNASPSVAVSKRWVLLNGRQFLIEEVPIVSVATAIDSLPPFIAAAGVRPKPVVSKNLILPPQRLTHASPKSLFVARVNPPTQGLVLDYVTMTSQTNWTFQGDTTYYISGVVNLSGTNAFEGGTSLKYAANATLNIAGINCLTASYRPVYFTGKDDDRTGEWISGTTHNPTGYYANPALNITASGQTFSNFRIAYAQQAIATTVGSERFYNGQIVNSGFGLTASSSTNFLRNVLFSNVKTNFNNLSSAGIDVQNGSFGPSAYLATVNSGVTVVVTNSILAYVTNLYSGSSTTFTGAYNGFFASSKFGVGALTNNTYPFQTVGAGAYYMANGSTFTNIGSANIDPTLLAYLSKLTTYPPVLYSNVPITNLTFSVQAQRDTNAVPDLGYHYAPIDYVFGGCSASSNITFTAGTAAGWFDLPGYNSAPGWGISLTNQVIISFYGTVTAPCTWARYETVQEGGNGLWVAKDTVGGLASYQYNSTNISQAPQIVANFTHFAEMWGDPNHVRDYYTPLILIAHNSEFWSGVLEGYNNSCYLTNCLIYRTPAGQVQGYNASNVFIIRNCTWHGGQVVFTPNYNPITLSVRDCAFDGTTFTMQYYATNGDYDYNAYTNGSAQLANSGPHDVVVTSYNWQTNWFGSFYLPPNSSLTNAGDVLANQVGLYHFTVLTNQVPEGTNTVSIGYHYVAADTNGNPLDSNGDGIPDYLEDPDGNGIVDSGETNWGLAILTQPVSQTVPQDTNVTFSVMAKGVSPISYQWYFNSNAIAGATGPALTLNNVQPAYEGPYFVIVSNFTGSLTSSVAYLVLTCTSVPSGLVGWWQGESNALDSIGGNNGYLSNGVTFVAGKIGTAFNFDGTNNFVRVPDSSILDPSNLTIEAWVKFNSLNSKVINASPGTQYIIYKQNSWTGSYNNEGYILAKLRGSGGDYFDFEVSSASGDNVVAEDSAHPIQTNVWYFIAGVRGSNYIQLYINGRLAVTNSVSFPQDDGVKPLYFGQTGISSWDGKLAGALDEVSLFSRALSSNEIMSLYQSESNSLRKCLVPPVIVTQPASQLSTVGENVTLMVVAVGSSPLSYQWYYNQTNFLSGATNAILILSNVQTANSGYYSVVVSNEEGATTSSNALLDVENCFLSLDVALVIDQSGSMMNNLSDGTQKLLAARIAATNFVQNLNFANDQAALFSFNDVVTTNQTLTNNLSALLKAIGLVTNAAGNTYMAPALRSAQTELAGTRQTIGALPVMVFLSDGDPTDLGLGTPDTSNLVMNAVTQAKAAGTRLITIALGTDADTNFMELMASSTSDSYYAATKQQLTNVYNLIAASICRGTNSIPTVKIVSPVNQTLLARSNVVISATATNTAPGVTISSVEFFSTTTNITNSLGFALVPTNSFYQLNWLPPVAGTNILIAEATDSRGATAWSAPVTNYVRSLPNVSITSPTNGQIFALSAPMTAINITIKATAVADGATITNVAFYYQATNEIGATNTGSPYIIIWTSVTNGTYSLTAQAADSTGAAGVSFPVTITIEPTNQPPRVNPGANQTNYLSTNAIPLNGVVSDDGLPVGNLVTITWTNLNGGTNVTFTNTTVAATAARYWATGTYTLQLSASDGQFTISSNVTITVLPANQPPYVNAGTNQTIIWPAQPNTNPIAIIYPTLFPQPILSPTAVDYFPGSNGLVVSFNQDGYAPYYNFETFSLNGATNQFAPFNNAGYELYIATVRNSLGGFTNGEMFSGDGKDGEILRTEPNGTTNAWVDLPSFTTNGVAIAPGALRGLWVDRTGIWDGDLIVSSLASGYGGTESPVGYLWRINSAGQVTFLAQLNRQDGAGDSFEGVTTIPNNVQKYGPWAGKILVGGDEPGSFFSVDTNGNVAQYKFPFGAEDIRVIPPNENFYVVNYAGGEHTGALWSAPASTFQAIAGDILVVDEAGEWNRIRWDGTNFDTYQIESGLASLEGGNFAPAGLTNLPSSSVVQLNGVVTDDFELFGPTSNYWTEISGPAPVSFGDPTHTNTTVEFSTNGVYVLQLSAFDGQYTSTNNVTIDIIQNLAASITNLTNQIITTSSTTLGAIVTDDGWPSNKLVLNWSVLSSNGTVNFTWTSETTNYTNVIVSDPVTFGAPGTYVLQLTASDGQASSSSNVTVSVQSPSLTVAPVYGIPTSTNVPYSVTATLLDTNSAPIVNTTINFSVITNGSVEINGSANTTSNGTATFAYTNKYSFFGRDTIKAFLNIEGFSLQAFAYKDWAASLQCGSVYLNGKAGQKGSYSREWTNMPADYYVFSGSSNQPILFTFVQSNSPFLMLLHDPSDQLVAATPIDFTTNDSVNALNYTPVTNGNYVAEIVPAQNQYTNYSLYFSCPGSPVFLPVVQVLYNGTNVPSGGAAIFPTINLGGSTNATLVISNGGNTSFSIVGVGTNGSFTVTNNLSSLITTFAPGYSTNIGVTFYAASNGVSFGALVLTTNAPDTASSNYVVYLEGSSFPTNATPTVQLISPINGSTYIDDSADGVYSYVPFIAAVTQGGNTQTPNVYLEQLTTNGLQYNYQQLFLDSGNFTYTNTFNSSAINPLGDGDVTVVAVATDVSDNTLAISSPALLHIVPYNNYPITFSPQLQVLYNGTNVTSGNTIALPQTLPGVTTNVTLIVTNSGNADLNITELLLSGNFYLTNSSISAIIPAGGWASFQVVFTASASGICPGQLTINNDGCVGGVYVANLAGYAYPPGQGPSSNTNQPPIAMGDQFTVFANSANNILNPLANDSDPQGYGLTIVSNTSPEFGTAAIINNGTVISYTPPPGKQGSDGFQYEISDGHGGTAWAQNLITVYASAAPSVNIVSPPNGYTTNAGNIVPLVASVTPSQYIAKVDFYQGQVLIGEVTNGLNGLYTTNWVAFFNPCGCGFTAQATDMFGQVSTSPEIFINVTQPSGVDLPSASLASFSDTSGMNTTPLTNYVTIRNGLFNVYGKAFQDQGSNVVWQSGVYSADGMTLLHNVASGSNPVTNTSLPLATCDLSALQNGSYDLRLTVTSDFMETNFDVPFILESGLKLGQFGFSQQDLIVPVNGIPLTITRTYNSLNPDEGDFGYGWTFAINSMDISMDETRQDIKDLDGNTFNQRAGGNWDVTLNLPNGQRTTFYYYLSVNSDLTCSPNWASQPGVTAKLQVQGNPVLYNFSGFVSTYLPYWNSGDSQNVPYNNFDFSSFVLKMPDNTQYTISRPDYGRHFVNNGKGGYYVHAYGPPALSKILERNGDTIQIGSTSVTYTATNGATHQITIQRNAAGLIKSISDPNGAVGGPPAVLYQYDNNDNLIAVERLVNTNGNGNYVTNSFLYTYVNFPHYISSIINGDGTSVAESSYDNSGRLTAVQDANGNTTHFIHNTTNNMEVVVDRLNNTNTYVYDPRGNVTAQTNALGQVRTMAYDLNNNNTNEVTYLGSQPYATSVYVYNTNLNVVVSSTDPLGHTSTFNYDQYGDLTNTIDARSNSTTNIYDSSGNLIATSDALGDTTTNFYQNGLLMGSRDALGIITTNYYDPNTDYLTNTEILDAGTRAILSFNSFTYDANGNRVTSTVWRQVNGNWVGATTTNVYDAMNRVIQTINPDGGANTVVYNLIGQQAATVDPLGNTNSFTYDTQGRLIQTTYPDGTTTSSGYDNNGNRVTSTDQLGRKTSYIYDALNRLVQTIYPDSTTNTTAFDGVGRVGQTIDGRGIITAFAYDAAGRRLAVTNAFGTSLATTTLYSYDPNGNQVTFTDGNSHTTTNVFDALNRQIQTVYPNGTTNFVVYDADGRRVIQTNQDQIVTLFGYDGASRLASVTNAANTTPTVTRYIYDQAGNEVAQVDALNRTNVFAYDGMGRRVWHTLPDGQSREGFAYDLAGNLVKQTNFDNTSIISYEYDRLNRLTNRISTGSSQYSYDLYSVNETYTYSLTGQRQSMADIPQNGQVAAYYIYDNRDRLIQKTVTWGSGSGPGAALYYGYDNDGNLTNLQSSFVNGVSLAYGYDPLNRLTSVLSHGQFAASYGYDGAGNLQTMRYGNGVTNLYQYDTLNRLVNLVSKYNTTTNASFVYQLMKGGMRTNLTETVNGTGRTYQWQYDNLYRLTNESISTIGNLGYSYDMVGNRTARQSGITQLPASSYTFNTNDELTATSNGNYGYDLNGNTIGVPGTTSLAYAYDSLNRLAYEFTNNSTLCSMVYDGDGNRVSKGVQLGNNMVTTFYLVDDRNPSGYAQVVEEYQSVGGNAATLNREYNYGLGLISQQQFNTNTYLPSMLSYYGYDGHGSVRFLMSTNGTVTDTYTYDAFGSLIASSGNTPNNYLYSGQQFDWDLGLYYNRARYLSSDTGRFWSRDSYDGNNEDPLSLHKYLYCQADPVNNTDPSGNDIEGMLDVMDISGTLDGIGLPMASMAQNRALQLGGIDVDVYIWKWKNLGVTGPGQHSVGHVMVIDHSTTGDSEVSQFPDPRGHTKGKNTRLDYTATLYAEEYRVAKKFLAHLPNDAAFHSEVDNQRARSIWDWWPTGPNETQCARAGYNVLKAGGLPLWGYGNQGKILPGDLLLKLEQLANFNRPSNPWSVEPIP